MKTKPNDASHLLPHPIQRVLEVGSMVQFGNPVRYGMIKEINRSPNSNEEFAEIETVSIHKLLVAIYIM